MGTMMLAAAVACGGGGSGGGDDGDGSSGGSDDDDDDDDGDDDDDDASACGDALPGHVGLQRLTRAEYNRTVRDLFGVTSDPASVFPPDSATDGFDNNASSLTISPQLASLLLDAAETVAADAMANDDGEILSCDPAADSECESDVLQALGRRVYRRPLSTAELADVVALAAFADDEGEDFEGRIEYALQGMLVSPQFLYRNVPPEGAAPLQPGDLAALDDFAIASRLSYFLWGSTPDDELLDAAEAGMLTGDDGLRQQFDRMLADDRADALYESFATQWLQLGKLASASPDPATFPQFDDTLRDAMLDETRLFFTDLIARDGSALEIVQGTQTFANATLAELYGVDGPTGDALVPIETDPSERAGVLTMPAVLTMTADPEEPNIVKRGVWLAETILCATPPPPPEGIPPAPEPMPGQTQRDILEQHRADPSCASCHDLIDPLGFSLEHYDGLGAWRDTASGQPVDAVGELPDGTQFDGVLELAEILATQDDSFRQCVTQKLMTYALGRALSPEDACVVEEIGTGSVSPDAGISDVLWAVVTSEAFTTEMIEGGE